MLCSSFSMSNISTIICYYVINLVVLLNDELEIPPIAVSMCLLLVWLILMIYVPKPNSFSLHAVKHGLHLFWLRDIPLQQWCKPKLRTGATHSKAHHFRRRTLPFNIVLRYKDLSLKANRLPRNIPFFVCRKTWTINFPNTICDRQSSAESQKFPTPGKRSDNL
jgi:hypothetical protein